MPARILLVVAFISVATCVVIFYGLRLFHTVSVHPVFFVVGKHIQNAKISSTPTPAPTLTESSPPLFAHPSPTPTLSPLPTKSPTPTPLVSPVSKTWNIQSIDAMKETKDAVCNQRDDTWINHWLDKAVELGANYVAISTPYDNPSCGDALSYTRRWVAAIRLHGLHVWHRHMPLAFEGIYNVSKNISINYLPMMASYIENNPDLFEEDDIFSPIPEPQNGGIQGVTYCANNLCQFSSANVFNQWLRDAMTQASDAFHSINKNNIKVGYFGFDGFVAWGDNNPDWEGILEDTTIAQMGNITIDHYPESVHETMDAGLTQLQAKYPTTPIIIGEWGTITGGDTVTQIMTDMTAARNHHVVGFNYWQFGPSGSGEQLIDNNFMSLPGFLAVQSFYRSH